MSHVATSLRPMGSRILVRPDPTPEKIGSLYIPPSAREKQKGRIEAGVVVAMGPGMPLSTGGRWPMPPIKPGDRVLFNAEGAYKIKLDVVDEGGKIREDVPHLMTRDTFIEAILEEV